MAAISRYDPSFCADIIKHCQEGGSITSFAGVVGVTKQTLYNWMDAHPDFKEAAEVARLTALALAEKAHWRLAMEGGKTSGLEYRMGNLSNWDWRHKTSTEVSGVEGGPVEVKTTVDVAGLTDEQLAVLASIHAG